MPSTVVTTSATTRDLPRVIERPGFEIVYEPPSDGETSYSVEPHSPTPRDDERDQR